MPNSYNSWHTEICGALGAALLKLRAKESFTWYIPALDWSVIADYMGGLPSHARHLASTTPRRRQKAVPKNAAGTPAVDPLTTVLAVLGVESADFSPDRPLVDYGLDSLGAARLAGALRPFVATSQVQLLAGATWADLAKDIVLPPAGAGDDAMVYGALPAAANEDGLVDVIVRSLGIARADLALAQPLVSYGLDSLGAARLARELRPFVQTTQVQLLGSATAGELLARHREATGGGAREDDVVIQLADGEGVPVIALHDVTGSVTTLLRLKPHFGSGGAGPLWVVQATRAAPLHSLPELAAFYHARIKEKVPHGPYRLAAFSASSVLSVALLCAFEDAGDVVLQHTFVDHFPAFWARVANVPVPDGQTHERAVKDVMVRSVVDMLRRDGRAGAAQADEISAAHEGRDASAHTHELLRVFNAMVGATLEFMRERAGGDIGRAIEAVTEWMACVRAPLALVVATAGIATTLPGGMREGWENLGVEHAKQPVARYHVNAGHFDVLARRETAEVIAGTRSA
jgi:acyl carrier protein/thioesterase domain-containing protein